MITYSLILVVSDINIPYKSIEIPELFKKMLVPDKVQHVISLGNSGDNETVNFLKSLSKEFTVIKGDYDENNLDLPETKTIKVGDFKLGLIHGHQVVPWGDIKSLSIKRKNIDCDILLHGFTGSSSFCTFEGKHYINPGSLTGSFSPINSENNPSFVILLVNGDFCICYKYEIIDGKKVEITKHEFDKLPEEILEEYKEIED